MYVDWSGSGVSNYASPGHGPNIWEYWFEQIFPEAMTCEPEDFVDLITTHKYHYSFLPFGALNLPVGSVNAAKRTISESIKPKQSLIDSVNLFYNSHLSGHRAIGAHVRGTDQWSAHGRNHPDGLPIERYFAAIDAKLNEFDMVFLATDSQKISERFSDKYGDRVVMQNSPRSNNGRGLHEGGFDGFAIGTGVLTDVLLLARCEYALLCSSNVSLAARCFGEFAYTYIDYDFHYVT